MRRADRLFHIIQLVRGRRLTTAAYLAERLEVSERTIYRDIADLQSQGVPLEGAAGVGYRLGAGFDLPPMMFTQEEAKALVASVRMAQAWLDLALATSAEDALGKILSVLPAEARVAAEALAVYAPTGGLSARSQRTLQTLREAVQEKRKVFIDYRDLSEQVSQRTVRPLGCFYWGKVWTLAAWCEEREDFRSFRVDRVQYVRRLDDRFRDEPGRTLADLHRLEQARSAADKDAPEEKVPVAAPVRAATPVTSRRSGAAVPLQAASAASMSRASDSGASWGA